tara:strand:+ start:380 stop:1090 length:711 start_codon:yes stop_codon:yes gene_type:complete
MNRHLKSAALISILPALLATQTAAARSVDIEITNLTHALYFTPLLVTAHKPSLNLFEPGHPASPQLQEMAEGGELDGLLQLASAAGAASTVNPAGGLLAPGAQTTVTGMKIKHHSQLSLMAMILPTNDGFVGLDNWTIPKKHGRYTVYLNAYDAGTEINDEVITGGGAPGVAGIPADPGGNSGTGATGVATMEEHAKVHIHRGVIGDRDLDGGSSDLDDRVHHWLNPVAKVVIWVK